MAFIAFWATVTLMVCLTTFIVVVVRMVALND